MKQFEVNTIRIHTLSNNEGICISSRRVSAASFTEALHAANKDTGKQYVGMQPLYTRDDYHSYTVGIVDDSKLYKITVRLIA